MQRLGGANKNDREGESKQSRQALDPGLEECLAASSITPRLQVSSSVSPEEGWLGKASMVPNLYPCWCLVASFPFASVLSVHRFRATSLSLYLPLLCLTEFQVAAFRVIFASWFPQGSLSNAKVTQPTIDLSIPGSAVFNLRKCDRVNAS